MSHTHLLVGTPLRNSSHDLGTFTHGA